MTPKPRAKILIDTREPESIKTALALAAEGAGVDTQEIALVSADYYITTTTGAQYIVERKAINDLHNSIADQRVYKELRGAMEADTSEVLLIMEGDLWAGRAGIYGDSYARAGVHPNSIRGTLLWAQRQGVRIVPTKDIDDSVQALLYLAKAAGVK